MKKLLSLLSVLIISGTAIPTTIAASPYQKQEEETIKNSDINYQQTNNLENLNRNKRDTRSNKNDIDYQFDLFGTSWLYLSITENFWNLIGESIVFYAKQNYDLEGFKNNFANNLVPNNINNKDWRVTYNHLKGIADVLWGRNYVKINETYTNKNNKRLWISIKCIVSPVNISGIYYLNESKTFDW